MRLNWTAIDLSKINLSSISGRTLAYLFKISPDLSHINMSHCSLSVSIVNEMIEECGSILKYKMLGLKGNDLSDIDGKSLVELIRVIHPYDKHYGYIEPFRWRDYSLSADNLQQLVESGVNMRLRLNWKMIDLSKINLSSVSGRTLACLFKISPGLSHIDMGYCSLSVSIVNELMEECGRMLKGNMLGLKGNDLSDIDGKSLAELVRVVYTQYKPFIWSDYSLSADNLQKLVESGVNMRLTLHWKTIDLSKINLSSISGRTLAYLFKISPDLFHINMSHCSLSVSIVNEMIEECGRILKYNMLGLKGNDLSDIDGKSLVELVRVIHPYDKHYVYIEPFRWRDYSLSADNLQKLVESGVNMRLRLNWKMIDLSKINLSSVSGRTLACLFKISPGLSHIDMGYCSLSVSIVNELMEECGRMLKDNMLGLEGNDLSDIDGKSLAELVRVVNKAYESFRWSDYSLSADNLQNLVESGVNMRLTLNWKRIDLSKINLSSISGRTLACLVKISPDLIHIDLGYCSLSVSIVNEMMEECGRMLKDNMLGLKGNDLSDIDGKSLAELVRVIHHPYADCANEPFRWSDYSLSADNLQQLVESGVNMRLTLNWKMIDLSKINLSSVSGRTLACLFKISPGLSHIDMGYCSLSVSIVNEMNEECGRMNVVLKDNMLRLEGNDLSCIDGKSLAELG
ncbi:uncharacterized protein LOC117120779 [Anneissia japonica]|uniref:uncharacterized protein LOC117120779 n=1 Tax=Anneissia japonica TaxID=1529436 RepID=UPI001425516E|nr:uncharacterized protein LOC117120779 [Anneissia japonica]